VLDHTIGDALSTRSQRRPAHPSLILFFLHHTATDPTKLSSAACKIRRRCPPSPNQLCSHFTYLHMYPLEHLRTPYEPQAARDLSFPCRHGSLGILVGACGRFAGGSRRRGWAHPERRHMPAICCLAGRGGAGSASCCPDGAAT
jgi:hypothetical protein